MVLKINLFYIGIHFIDALRDTHNRLLAYSSFLNSLNVEFFQSFKSVCQVAFNIDFLSKNLCMVAIVVFTVKDLLCCL